MIGRLYFPRFGDDHKPWARFNHLRARNLGFSALLPLSSTELVTSLLTVWDSPMSLLPQLWNCPGRKFAMCSFYMACSAWWRQVPWVCTWWRVCAEGSAHSLFARPKLSAQLKLCSIWSAPQWRLSIPVLSSCPQLRYIWISLQGWSLPCRYEKIFVACCWSLSLATIVKR